MKSVSNAHTCAAVDGCATTSQLKLTTAEPHPNRVPGTECNKNVPIECGALFSSFFETCFLGLFLVQSMPSPKGGSRSTTPPARRPSSSSGAKAFPSVGEGGKGTGSAGENGLASFSEAVDLFSRMRQREETTRRAVEDTGAREALIKARYAKFSTADCDTHNVAPSDGGASVFDKNALLTELLADTRSNFLKLDQSLSEDYDIASRRLRAAVFSHTSDFLQLFRDVNKASTLVETLKSNVQFTKASISAVSKFSACSARSGIHHSTGAEGGDSTLPAALRLSLLHREKSNALGDVGGQSEKTRTRPSLIAANLSRRQSCRYTMGPFAMPSYGAAGRTCGLAGGGASGYSKDDANDCGSGPGDSRTRVCRRYVRGVRLLSTTRSLNTTSVRLWRSMILSGDRLDGGDATSSRTHLEIQQATTSHSKNAEAVGDDKDSQLLDIALFVDVLRREVMQTIAERRYADTAELLWSAEAEATAKGCLPLLLELEGSLVRAIQQHVKTLPMPLMYSESLHVPLIKLLLRFGCGQCGLKLFFHLHAVWLDSEMEKLQLRHNTHNDALIASDFLVGAVLDVLQRQRNLLCSSVSYEPVGKDKEAVTRSARGVPATGRSGSGGQAVGNSMQQEMPPSSTALLWVHGRLDKLVREVLQPRALSYGIGAEGGDPSRFRRAVVMATEAIRTVRRLDEFGFAGCDTQLLLLLTPSLIYLQNDFSRCTNVRLITTGMAMVGHLLQDVRRMHETNGAAYNVKMCGEVSRRNNSDCRELQQRLKSLPPTSYALLLELLLAPASSSLFRLCRPGSVSNNPHDSGSVASGCDSDGGSCADALTVCNSFERSPSVALLSEQYTFLRYANGCTRVHGLLLTSVLRFVASMTGYDVLPLELTGRQCKQAPEQQINQVECVSFLLSNSLVAESIDVTLHRLFLSFMHAALLQRRTLLAFLLSSEYRGAHVAKPAVTSPRLPFANQRLLSHPWVLGAMQLLLADVLAASVWVAFLSRGGALSQLLLLSNAQTFRVHYLEELRSVLPRIVQGWMVAALCMAHNSSTPRDLVDFASSIICDTEAPVSEKGSHIDDSVDPRDSIAQLLQASAVKEVRVMPFLLALIQRPFEALVQGVEEAPLLCAPLPSRPSPLWCLRERLGNYPMFPLGGNFDKRDEFFLLHWFVQISLNTLAFLQESLLVPCHVTNERWSAAHSAAAEDQQLPQTAPTLPLSGCVSPQEESVIASLAAGGGNYVSAIGLTQFIVFRLLRDVLCRLKTWSAVYGIPMEEIPQSEDILRQQIFFFALFIRFWSPLFVGSANTSLPGERATVSSRNGNIDDAPSMVILQWLTCAEGTGGCGGAQGSGTKDGTDVEALAFPLHPVTQGVPTNSSEAGKWSRRRGSSCSSQILSPKRVGVDNSEGAGSRVKSPNSHDMNATIMKSPNSTCSHGKNGNEYSLLLLEVVESFFNSFHESRAMPAITSRATSSRVEKVMTSLDLTAFVGKADLNDLSDIEEAGAHSGDEDTAEENNGSKSDTHPGSHQQVSSSELTGIQPTKRRGRAMVTLLHMHNMLWHYIAPLK
ncbi:hypothetical protein TRVL_00133 [Trypanosoma vivax]|uniref:Uncharacterized protein n=1 Tax=Trypanosoma vivax (strain Y486) TaxID=1055687 RepID=G0TYZ2_TRYVY|nr:hypothetical protein TRVL_00133 [Trypanosoma vivax]CCC49195.1 conserved hypothetical protein [Trypanosoma vivax Y486]